MRTVLLFTLACLLHWISPAAECLPNPPGALGIWAFSNTPHDSLSVLSGTLKDNAHYEPGFVGQSLVLDGSTDRIDLGNPPSLHVQDFTIECWIKRGSLTAASASFPADGALFSGSTGAYAVTIAANGTLFIGHVGFFSVYSSARVHDLEWHHVGVTKLGTSVRFYLDGALVDQKVFLPQFTFEGPFAIGGLGSDFGGQFFSFLGSIDNLAIYNRQLSDSELNAIYKAGARDRCVAATLAWSSKSTHTVQGEPMTASLEVRAAGSSTLSNLTAQIRVPENSTILSASTPKGACSITGTLANCTLDSLEPGARTQIDIQFTLERLGSNTIQAILSSTTGGTTTWLNSAGLNVENRPGCNGLAEGLVSWWKAEGTTSDQFRVSGATIVGTVTYEEGASGQAFKLDGRSYIQLNSPQQYHLSNFTIESWIKRGDLNRASFAVFPDGAIFAGGDRSFGLTLAADGTPFLTHVGVVSMRANRQIQDLGWHHVAVTKSGRSLKFYLDGAEAGSATFDGRYEFTTPFSIGALGAPFAGESYAFIGSIDELALFNTALSSEEIRAIYNAGSSGKCQDDISLRFTAAPGIVRTETITTFHATAANFGAQPASNSVVLWPLKPGQSFVRSSLPEAACSVQNSVVRCELGTLRPQSTLELEFQMKFTRTGETKHELTITRGEPDAIISNNTARATTYIIDDCLAPLPGLISRWSAEGNAWDTFGTASGIAPTISYSPGVDSGQAFAFDGKTTLALNDSPHHRPARFTWSLWVRPTSYEGNHEILVSQERLSGNGAHSRLAILGIGGPLYPAGTLLFNIGVPDWPNGSNTWATVPRVIPTGEWTHVALTYETNGTAVVYVNGAASSTLVVGAQPAPAFGEEPGVFTFGGPGPKSTYSHASNRFDGSLDEIALYDRPLSPSEILALAQAKTAVLCRRDLAATWIDAPKSLPPGTSASLGLAIRNGGDTLVSRPVLRVSSTTGLPILGVNVNGTSCPISNGVAECSLSDLPPGTEAVVRVFVRAEGKPGTQTLTAFASSTAPNDAPNNNTAAHPIEILSACQSVEHLVAWWPFENTHADRVQDLTRSSTGIGVFLPGRVGQAIRLGDSFIPLQSVLPGLPTNRLTVEAWIQRHDTTRSSPNGLFGSLLGSGTGAWNFSLAPNGALMFGSTGIGRVESKPVITDLAWHHVAVTLANGVVTLFADGEPVLTTPFAFNLQYKNKFTVGGIYSPDGNIQNILLGNLDELSVYSEALSPEQIRGIHAVGSGGKCFEDLAVSVDPQVVSVEAGGSIGFRFDVSNRGSSIAPRARLRMEVPEGYSLGNVRNPGGACTLTRGLIQCELGHLVPGAHLQLELEIGTSPRATELTLEPAVSSELPDAFPGNNRAAVQLAVLGPCLEAPPGLAAWWRGEGSRSDFIHFQVAAVLQGGPPAFSPGRVGRAFEFNGSQGIGITEANSLATPALTLAAWVRPTKLDGAVDIIAVHEKPTTPESPNFALGIRGSRFAGTGKIPEGQLCFQVGNMTGLPQDFGKWVDARASIPLGTWTFVTLTVDPELHSIAISVNGEETRRLEFFSGGIASNSGGFYIGSHSTQANQVSSEYIWDRFSGGIDELMLFDRALALHELRALFNSGQQGVCPSDLQLQLDPSFTGIIPLNQLFSVEVRVTNHDSNAAKGVRLTNTVPAFIQFQNAKASLPNILTTVRDGKLITDFGTLPPASTASIQYFFQASEGNNGHWTASLSSQSLDLNPSNNGFTRSLTTVPIELVIEGTSSVDVPNEDLGALGFEVRSSLPSLTPITVEYTTQAGSATEGVDYLRTTGTLTLAPGQTRASIRVPVLNDGIPEEIESFTMVLSNPTGATLKTTTATGFIVSAPTQSAFSIDDVTIPEGTGAPNTATFTVSLSSASREPVSIQYSTVNGTARSGVDYVATEGTLTFAPGETTKRVSVRTVPDGAQESNEQFTLVLKNPTGAAVDDAIGVATLLNDDGLTGQLAEFQCEILSQPTQLDGKTSIRVTALDAAGNAIPNYAGAVSLSAHLGSGGPVGIVLTEIYSEGFVVALEFQNVGSSKVDISGWTVTLFDTDRWPAPKVSFTFPNDTQVQPKELIVLNDRSPSMNLGVKTFTLGTPLAWTTSRPEFIPTQMGFILQDETGRVRDTFFADGATPQDVSVPVQLKARDWKGSPVVRGNWDRVTYSRTGGSHTASGSSWTWSTPSPGIQNDRLILPFVEGQPFVVTPEFASDFVNGVYQSQVQVTPLATGYRIFVDDGNGHTGVSGPITPPLTGDVSLELLSPAMITAGSPVQFIARIYNPGPTTVGPLSTFIRIQGNVSEVKGFVGSNSHGSTPTIEGVPGRWVINASVDSILPNTQAEIRVSLNSDLLQVSGSIHALAGVSKAVTDLNELNNSAETRIELAQPPYVAPRTEVAWWPATDGARDLAGSHHGTLLGSVQITPGRVGPGFKFAGEDAAIVVPTSSDLNLSSGTTLSFDFWMRTDTLDSGARIHVFSKRDPKTGVGYAMTLRAGIPEFTLFSPAPGSQPIVVRGSQLRPLDDGEWHHVAVALDRTGASGRMTLLVDGIGAAAVTAQAQVDFGNSAPLQFGARPTIGDELPFVGELDEITFWSQDILPLAASMVASGSNGRWANTITAQLATPLALGTGANGTELPDGVQNQPYRLQFDARNHGPRAAYNVRMQVRFSTIPSVLLIDAGPGASSRALLPTLWEITLPMLPPASTVPLVVRFTSNDSEQFVQTTLISELPNQQVVQPQALHVGFKPDTDGDGMDDAHEFAHGFNPANPADGALDMDGDGASNASEYRAGTSPLDPENVLDIQAFPSLGGGIELEWVAQPHRLYQIVRRTTLADAPWEVVAQYIGTEIQRMSAHDVTPPEGSAWYAVRVLP